MERKPLQRFAGLIATALVALVLVGCKGSDGRNGTDGTPGTPGTNSTPVIAATALTEDQWVNLKPTINVIGTPVVAATGPLSVTFEVKDGAGNRITGLDTWKTKSILKNTRSNDYAFYYSYSNFGFGLAKLIPEDAVSKAPSKWVNYFVTSVPTKLALADTTATKPATLTRPSTDNNGTLVQNADGTYTYTFFRDLAGVLNIYNNFTDAAPSLKADLGSVADLTFDAAKIHRLVIQFYGNQRDTGSNTENGVTTTAAVAMANPVNYFYDWIPSTKAVVAPTDPTQREIVATAKCNECHDKIGTTTPHGGRVDTRFCVVCHNDQRKFGYATSVPTAGAYTGNTYKFAIGAGSADTMAAGDMPVMVHKIHMGDELSRTGYNYANIKFETLAYPMGRDMCAKCHSGTIGTTEGKTVQGENWNIKPSRKACASCHDAADFVNGWTTASTYTHPAQSNDAACAGCHVKPGDPADIKVAHYTKNVLQTTHNPVVQTGLYNFKYEISSVTQATSGGPVTIKFRILSDGGVPGAPLTPVVFKAAAAGLTAPLDGFTGSPAFLMSWALPQPGETTTPADYNNLGAKQVVTASGVTAGTPLRNHQPASFSIANLLNTDLATQVGTIAVPPAADGTYTATIVGANAIFPAGAKLRGVALQGYFTQISPAAARHTEAAYAYVDARRKVIDSNKCSNCHEAFEGHGGNRVKEVQVCVMCHVPGLTTSGRGMTNAQISTAYTGLTADQKAALTTWTGVNFATDPTAGGANPDLALKFPQTSNNMKDMIHGLHMGAKRTSPMKDIRGDRWAIIDASKLVFPGIIQQCTDCHTYNGFSGVAANTLATREEAINLAGNTTQALAYAALAQDNDTDLMTTPFTSSCVSCHDTTAAQAHMRLNGGQIKVARSTLATASESCAVCHGSGSTYDPVKVHK